MEYEVDRILDKKINEQGKILYKISWKGYPSDYDTWEPAENLFRCKKAIEKFENSLQRALPIAAAAEKISVGADQNCVDAEQNSVGAEQSSVSAEQNSVGAEQNSIDAEPNSIDAEQISVGAEQNSADAGRNSAVDQPKIDRKRRRQSYTNAVWQIANNLEASEPSSSSRSSSPTIFDVGEKIPSSPPPLIFVKKRRTSTSSTRTTTTEKRKFRPKIKTSTDKKLNDTIEDVFSKVLNDVVRSRETPCPVVGENSAVAAAAEKNSVVVAAGEKNSVAADAVGENSVIDAAVGKNLAVDSVGKNSVVVDDVESSPTTTWRISSAFRSPSLSSSSDDDTTLTSRWTPPMTSATLLTSSSPLNNYSNAAAIESPVDNNVAAAQSCLENLAAAQSSLDNLAAAQSSFDNIAAAQSSLGNNAATAQSSLGNNAAAAQSSLGNNTTAQSLLDNNTAAQSSLDNNTAAQSSLDNNTAAQSSLRPSPTISIVDKASIGFPNDDQSCKILLVKNPFADDNDDDMVDGFSVEDQKLNHLINDIIADLSILDRLGDRLREKSRKNHQSPVQLAMRCLVENERDDVNFCQDLTLSNLQNYEEFCSDLRNLDQFLTKNLSILKDEKSGNLNFKFRQYLLNGNFDDLKNLLDDSPNLDVNFSFDDKNALAICCSTPCSSQNHVRCRLLSTLITKGCSVNRQDGVGQTALSIAVRNGHICQTEILLKNGADPNLLNNMNENALFTAVRYCPAEKICDILDLLLDRGFGNLYARNVYGQKIGTVVRETGRENLLFRFFDQYQTRLEQNFHLYFKQTFDMKYALSKNVQILQLRYHKLNNKSSDYLSVQFKISDIWVPENYAPWLFLAVAENNAAGNGTKFSPTKNFLNADVFLNGVRLEAVSKFTKDILWFNVSYGMNKLDFHFEIKTDEPITVAFQANVVRYNA